MAKFTHLWLLAVAAVTALTAAPAGAQPGTWTQNGLGSPYTWGDAANWNSSIIADGANNTAFFNTPGLQGPIIISLGADQTIGNLYFDNPSNAFSWTIAQSSNLILSATGTPTITVDNVNLTASIAASIQGTQGFIKLGTGTLSLAGINGYTGDTTVNNGTLNLDFSAGLTLSSILPSATNLTLGSGGSLTLTTAAQAVTQSVAGLTLNPGAGIVGIGITGGGTVGLSLNTITRNSGSVVAFVAPSTGGTITTSNTTTNGILGGWAIYLNNTNGATGFATSNAGTVAPLATYTAIETVTPNPITNAAQNFVAGNNIDMVRSGLQSPNPGATANSVRFNNAGGTDYTLSLSGANTIQSGGILVTSNVGGGAGTFITGGSLTSGNGTDLIITQNNFYKPLVITSQITGAIGVTTAGFGTTVLGASNTYTGPTVVGGGTLLANSTAALPGYNVGSTVFVQGGGTLSVSTSDLGPWLPADINTLRANAVFSPGFALGFDVAIGSSLTYNTAISGNLGVTKNNDGALVLTGASSYTGPTTINGGTLTAGNIANSGSNSAIGAGDNLVFGTGGTFSYTGATASVNRGILLNFNGGVVNVATGGTNLGLSGLVYGVGGLTKSGPGTLTVSGTGTYAGPTLVTGGNLAFTGANSIPANNNLTIFQGATVTIGAGATPTLSALSGGGTLNLGVATQLNLGSDFGSGAFQGTISGGAGLTVVKNGSGIQALLGNNTFSGGLTVNGGTLLVSPQTAGVNPLGTGTVTLATAGVTFAYRQLLPVPTTGYNRDVIYGVGEGSNSPLRSTADLKATIGFDVINNQLYYSAGVPGGNTGLPRNLAINSLVGGGSTFILQPYNANNVVFLTAGQTATLGIGSPGSFRSLNLLTASTNNASTFNATLNFQDGTSTIVTGLSSPDWFNATTNIAAQGLDRYNFVPNTFDGGGTVSGNNPRLYQVGITLSAADSAKVLTSVTLASTVAAGLANAFGVFAINGTTSGAPATLSPGNAVAITAAGNTNLEVSGFTSVAFGALTLDGSFGANLVSLAGTVGSTMSYSGTTFVSSAPTITVATGVTLNLGTLTDANTGIGFTKTGAGTLILAGGNAYVGGIGAGSTAITAGTLIAQTPAALPGFNTFGNVSLNAGAALVAGFGAGQFTQANITTLLANVNFVSGSQFGLDVSTGTGTYNSVITLPTGVGFVKTGAGTLVVGNANTYTGTTTISGGTLTAGVLGLAGAPSSIGASAAAAGNLVFNNGALLLYTGGTNTTNRSFTLNAGTGTASGGGFNIPTGTILTLSGASAGGGIFYKDGAGTLLLTGTNASTGGVTITAGTLQVGAGGSAGALGSGAIINNGTLTYFRADAVTQGNAISGTGNLVKLGAGSLTLSGANTYTGSTTVSAGTLQAGSISAFGTGSAVSLATGTFLAFNGNSNTIGAISGAGTVTNNSGTNIVLTLGDATSTTFSGVIQNGSTGTLAVVKNGTGTLTLTGPSTFTGGVTLNNGTITVSTDAALGTGPFTSTAFGTLNFTATTTTARIYNLFNGSLSVGTGTTLTMAGSQIGGGYVSGGGTISTQAATGGQFVGVTVQPSVSVTSNSAFDRFSNTSFGGALTAASGSAAQLNGFFNMPAGRLNVGSGASISVNNFQSAGVLNVTGTGQLTNTGSTPIVLGGGSVTNVGVYNTNNGQVTVGGTINIGAQNITVQGGFLRNNGTITGTGTLIVDFGGVVKGIGDFDTGGTIVRNGGVLLAGNSPGMQPQSTLNLANGANTGGDLNNATGVLGGYPTAANNNTAASGWSAFEYGSGSNPTGGSLTLSRGLAGPVVWKFRTTVNDGTGNTPGAPANFSTSNNYSWTIFRPRTDSFTLQGPATTQVNTGAPINLFDASGNALPLTPASLAQVLTFDRSEFIDPATGLPISPTAGTFSFSFGPDLLGTPNRSIILNFVSAVPEPSVALLGLAAVALLARRRKA